MILPLAYILALQVTSGYALKIAGLGSSFAAGPGLQSSQNYAAILAKKLNANLTDVSVSGSTLLSMKSQISKVPADTDIITITSGGNDIGFIGGLTMESMLGRASTPSISESELLKRFNDDLAQIHTIAPKAKVYLVEYLTILGPDVKPGVDVPFNAQRVEYHRSVAETLLRATRKAAEGKKWVVVVPTAKDSVHHGVGSKTPWVNSNKVGNEGGIFWHPNRLGMEAIASLLHTTIKSTK
jgi:hypothetical protein